MSDLPITDQYLDEIEVRCNAATQGPWVYDDYGDMIWATDPYGHGLMHVLDIRGWGHLTGDGTCRFSEDKAIAIQEANGAFAAHSRADVPRLVAEIRRLRAELQNAEPVKYGWWIPMWDEARGLRYGCSSCAMTYPEQEDYCPNCGAMMDATCAEATATDGTGN